MSVAEYLKVWVLKQPSSKISPGVHETERDPSQLSLAVTPLSQLGGVGLQPRSLPVGTLDSIGSVMSTFQVNVCSQDDVFPQRSVAVYVLV
jgi:hypothetical protein